ncbi:MAG TPA: helix-turn-helix transcriptional regulator, partial [Thermoanaerobaculia bacterium]|nr:helix-turn-helix transcriptional regulator [Thermoanaerobaculia bacterium]
MADEILPDLSIVLGFLRAGHGVSKAELGRLSGVPPKLIHEYERGRKALNRKRLEHLISFLDLPPAVIDETLACLEANRASARPPDGGGDSSPGSRRRIEAAAARSGRMAADFVRSFLKTLTLEGEALTARQEADFLWSKLKRRKPAERRILVEDGKRFRTWALCEKVAAESIEAAGNDPREALELAELSLRIAERVPGEQAWRWRLEGYAGVHIANARRICGDLRGADQEIARAKNLWGAGAPGDPGLLSEARVLWLEATLRRAQRRFPEAIQRLAEAVAVDQGDIRGRLLLTKAQILYIQGDIENSTSLLQEAVLFVDIQREPRLALGVRFQFLANLCHDG